jgi:hypothetical protein
MTYADALTLAARLRAERDRFGGLPVRLLARDADDLEAQIAAAIGEQREYGPKLKTVTYHLDPAGRRPTAATAVFVELDQ